MIQVNFRTEDDVKAEADYILSKIGISMSAALNMFIHQLVIHRGIPFEVVVPRDPLADPDRIRQAMDDYENGAVNYHYHELPEDAEESANTSGQRNRRTRRAKAMV